ncbi:MAG: nuclease-related domain-containing protein [Actinomycetota bacterium]
MKVRRSLYARPEIHPRTAMHHGCVAGASGGGRQRRTARLLAPLERHGWAILHDLAVPGSAANIDHLVIGPGGVFVIDSKQYRGRLQLDACRRLWHGRHPLAPALRAVSFEADRAAQVPADPPVVVPILAVHSARSPAARSWSAACGSCRPGACPACLVPSGARTGRRRGQSGPNPLPRCRLTACPRRRLAATPGLATGRLPGASRPIDGRISQTDSCTAARRRRPTGLGRGRPPVPRVGQRATMLPGAA